MPLRCALLLLVLALPGGCAPRRVLSQNSKLGTVVSVEPVQVTEGFEVWRDGREVTVRDGLVIQLRGVEGGDFIPGALPGPRFVLDDTVGHTLADPSLCTVTLLVMAAPPADTEVALWMTQRGVHPEKLVGTGLRMERSAALSAEGSAGLNLRTPPARTPKATYRTYRELSDSVGGCWMRSPQWCAELGKQCGLHVNPMGIDCGTCPEGQVCTKDGQCEP